MSARSTSLVGRAGGVDAGIHSARADRTHRRRRDALVCLVLGALALVLAALSLAVGSFSLSPAELLATLAGQGPQGAEFVVFRLRLPRLVLAVLVAVAFGLAGALLQSLLRNPLASPDLIGISGGASAGAVTALLVLGLSGPVVSLAAFAGALAAAAVIYLLAWRDGVTGYRFVLIGIALAFLVTALVNYLLSRADVREAQTALTWLVGSVAGARWEDIAVLAAALVVLVPATAAVAPTLRALQLGDDIARGLGVRADRGRLAVLLVAVALAGVATAAAGPVAFLAFAAAPIARRIVGTGSLALAPAALVAVVIMLGADLVAQHALGDLQVPVGIVTAAVGAPYLLYLLATGGRSGRVA